MVLAKIDDIGGHSRDVVHLCEQEMFIGFCLKQDGA
jgi:hypothetical protein